MPANKSRGLGLWDADLLDEDVDGDDDVMSLIRTNRGQSRTMSRQTGEYRRSNRFVEDGYGDQDFG